MVTDVRLCSWHPAAAAKWKKMMGNQCLLKICRLRFAIDRMGTHQLAEAGCRSIPVKLDHSA
jgi:hypothetical protein